jgi:hypothetical protein
LEAATTGANRGFIVFAVVTDPIGQEHRAHKVCSNPLDCNGDKNPWKWARDEMAPRVELP